MVAEGVAEFGEAVADVLAEVIGPKLLGVWFVGSVALGGYVPGESDVDIVAVSREALTKQEKDDVAAAVIGVSASCPGRGVEFTLYRRDVVAAQPEGADFEVNANGGPQMPTAVHLDPAAEPGFWYVLDRAIAHRAGAVVIGPAPSKVFVDVPRSRLLQAMQQSMAWHRTHEKASLYSVLNACRAWRFADEDVLGSKLEGAVWAHLRWPDSDVIDAAVALRRGQPAPALEASAVDDLLGAVLARLDEAV